MSSLFSDCSGKFCLRKWLPTLQAEKPGGHRAVWSCLQVEHPTHIPKTLFLVESVWATFLTLILSLCSPWLSPAIWSTMSFRLWPLVTSFMNHGLSSNTFEAFFSLRLIDNISSTDHQFLGILNPSQSVSFSCQSPAPMGESLFWEWATVTVSVMQLLLVQEAGNEGVTQIKLPRIQGTAASFPTLSLGFLLSQSSSPLG